ncbi:MAG: LCP family protein [Candidatus Promineifilaceae bacterium]|jgi:polyisoprenyl-teichoic acid--peptidoglycan teichoic acid transferase
MRRLSLRLPNRLFVLFVLALLVLGAGCHGFSGPTPTPFAEQISSNSEGEAEPEATPTLEMAEAALTAETASDEEPDGDEIEVPPASDTPEKPDASETKVTPEPTGKPTRTPPPTATPIPSTTPTSAPQFAPVLQIQEPQPVREGVSTPATAIPTAVPEFTIPKGTTNILLLGSDEPVGDGGVKRTDTMIIVSVDPDGPTASMISLPRDLYVYIPGGTMSRLNSAVTLGGIELLKQTILYNFGVPIHYYAQVDFQGFEDVVDAIGGVEVAVSCPFKDWRIKSPELDPEDEDNWYVFELEPGIYEMDGDTALWYARSRLMSNDFDRGRRQQQLLRAMLNQGVKLDLVPQVPVLWNSYKDSVETDMDIGRMLQIASLAPAIRENGVQNLYLMGKTESWIVPDTNAQVQLPIWEGPGNMSDTFQRLFLPPALNKANRAPIEVEIVNASGNEELPRLAAENLAWHGFVPVINDEEMPEKKITTLTYFGPNFKGSYDWLISWIFHLRQSDVVLNDEDTEFSYNYQVVLGQDFDPCLNELFAPQSFLP